MRVFKCSMCGYMYKEDKGDWMSGLEKGTKWEKIPDEWRCPTCNQPKVAFQELRK